MDISGYGINRRCMLFCGSYNSDEENQENTNGTGTKEWNRKEANAPSKRGGKIITLFSFYYIISMAFKLFHSFVG